MCDLLQVNAECTNVSDNIYCKREIAYRLNMLRFMELKQ